MTTSGVGTDELSGELFQRAAQLGRQSIVIRRARSDERAVEAAKRRFERLCHVTDWTLYADGVELEMDQRSAREFGRASPNDVVVALRLVLQLDLGSRGTGRLFCRAQSERSGAFLYLL